MEPRPRYPGFPGMRPRLFVYLLLSLTMVLYPIMVLIVLTDIEISDAERYYAIADMTALFLLGIVVAACA